MENLSQPTPVPPTAYFAGRGVSNMSQPPARMNVNPAEREKDGKSDLANTSSTNGIFCRNGVRSMSQPPATVNVNHQLRGKGMESLGQATPVPSTSSATRGVNNVNEQHVERVNKLLVQREGNQWRNFSWKDSWQRKDTFNHG
ncbi:uncharacterized protein LOC132302418 isoform X2 [Cornus florida]|uniref:uncharacterized protein LOC132302418 isoform X2 n=1 Tax=Cornus florida TaxID=4283 RepID=UPI0028986D82|nr:uncharacterized protein LOC132302418 isoform X2 [Cornus florida]